MTDKKQSKELGTRIASNEVTLQKGKVAIGTHNLKVVKAADNEGGDLGQQVQEFVEDLLAAVTVGHIAHLLTYSYEQHKALDAFYNGVGDYADSIAEKWQKQGRFSTINVVSDLPSDGVELVTYILDEATAMIVILGNSPENAWLSNICQDIQAFCRETLYQLSLV